MSAESTTKHLKETLAKILAKDDLESDIVIERAKDCLTQLESVDMTLAILTETLIGATVAKFKSHAKLGPQVKAVVKKWKQVAKTGGPQSAGKAPPETDGGLTAASDAWKGLPGNRQGVCKKLFEVLTLAKSALVEAGMNASVVDSCLGNTAVEIEAAITGAFPDRKKGIDKVRSIAFNLKKNTQLSQNLVYGTVTSEELIHMTAEQLASADQRKEREQEAKKLIDSKRLDWDQANEAKINEMCGIKGDLLKASLFTCGRCKSVKTTSTQKQTRSADEPMTVFVLCLNCGNRWKC